FDEPAVLDVERVVARPDAHLAVRVGLGDDAAIDRGDDLLLRVRPVLHEGAGHARHRREAIRLPPPGTGGLHAVLAGPDRGVQVRTQDAVLHQDRAAARVALVVVIARAALARDGRLVDDRDERLRDLLADHVRIDARPLAVEIGFHAVTD